MPREGRSRAKKAVRSDEDKPLYLQQRAQAEAELARKKEEILTHFLRDKLQDDEKNSALNLLKLNDGWRSILRQKKSTEIQKDLAILQQTFERQVDLLDSIIKNLEVNVSEAESQSAQLHRSHLQQIQTLLELQRKRMDYLEQGWESAMEKIQDQYTTQREQRTAEIQQQHQYIDDNSLLVQHNYDEMMNEIAAVYRQSMEFYENLFLDKVKKLEKIPEERRREHQQLMQQHSARLQELEALIKENQESTKSIEQRSAEIQRLQKKLFDLQTGDNGLSEVEHQLSVTAEGIQTLREQMEQERRKSRRRLIVLSVNNDKAAKKLHNVVNTGERILRLAKLCKKLEDKLLITEEMDTPPGNELAEEDKEPELKLLNARQNSALLQREVLRRRRDAMRHENTQLQLKIQQLREHRETLTISGQSIPRADIKKDAVMLQDRKKQAQIHLWGVPCLSLEHKSP